MLTVEKIGNGSGTITSDLEGIDCGDDCAELYPTGTEVALTAVESSDSIFEGWSGGGCSGTGTCSVTLNESITVNATFTLSPLTTSTTSTVSPEPCPVEEIYGEGSEVVQLVRNFRDSVLSKTPEGQELIKLYYEWSSVVVRLMEEDESFKEKVQGVIDDILSVTERIRCQILREITIALSKKSL